MVTPGLIFEGPPPGSFPQQKNCFTFLPPVHKSSNFSTSVLGQHFFKKIIAVLMGVKSGVSWWF